MILQKCQELYDLLNENKDDLTVKDLTFLTALQTYIAQLNYANWHGDEQ